MPLGMAGNNNMKRLGVFAVVALLSMFIMIGVAAYFFMEAPPVVVAVMAVVGIILVAVVVYEAKVRLKEIDEGLDDAVDDY